MKNKKQKGYVLLIVMILSFVMAITVVATSLILFRYSLHAKGSLEDLLPLIDHIAIDRAIKMGAGNIYHGCVHNMLHEKSEEILKGLYKAASFVVQAIVFKQTGNYFKYQSQLLQEASAEEQLITETFLKYKSGEAVDFSEAPRMLFEWSKKWIKTLC